MNLSVGIVGLPNVGKSTLFNALLKKSVAASANYPFTTIEPNVGVVEVPDSHLQALAKTIVNENSKSGARNPKQIQNSNEILKPFGFAQGEPFNVPQGEPFNVPQGEQVQDDKHGWPPIVHATVEFVDIAGLVKGAHKGEGLGNQFLSHIREVDVICFVLRDFKGEDIINTGENPIEDLEILKSELQLKDLETLEKVVDAKNKKSETGNRDFLEKVKGFVAGGKWLRDELAAEELDRISDLQLLSSKKTIVVVNSDEADLGKEAPIEGAIRICAKMEEELASLAEAEQVEYLNEVGVNEPGLNILITKAYEILDLASFYTAGVKEVKAWTIKRGSLAPQAAGVIHTDFERGFIACDVAGFGDFIKCGGWRGVREKGKVKTIGKSEIMPEDVVVEFKFSI